MNWLKNIFRYTWISAWYSFALVVVLVATIFSSIRLILPFAGDYNAELSEEISRQLGQPVSIGMLDAEWHGWDPSLILRDINLLDAETRQSIFKLGNIRVELDVLTSLALQKPVFSSITLIGVDLLVTRDEDGRLSVAGVQGRQPAAGDREEAGDKDKANLNRLAGWIMSQGRIGLEDSALSWHDQYERDQILRFSEVSLSLQNQGERHLLSASVALPRELGNSLRIHVDIVGDLLQAQGRQVSAFVEGKGVNVSRILQDQVQLRDLDVALNAADFTLWSEWEAGKLLQLQGDVSSQDVVLAPVLQAKRATGNMQFDRVAARFSWQRAEHGWNLEADDVLLASAGRIPQAARVSARYGTDGSLALQARLGSVELNDVTRLVSLLPLENPRLSDALDSLAAQGSLHDSYLQYQTGVAVSRYQLYSDVQGVSSGAWGKLPALSNVEGQVWLTGELAKETGQAKVNAQLELRQAGALVNMPEIFREPIAVDKLQGQLELQLDDKRWHLSGRQLALANEDISINASLDMVLDDEQRAPFLSVIASFRDGDGSKVSRYLPAGKMKKKALDWLDRGIVGGRVLSGGAVFNGRVRDFPFDDGSGRFEVALKVKDARLNYARDWPRVEGIDADVQFLGRSMTVQASKGSILSNHIRHAAVYIPNMKAKPLRVEISGDVSGSTQDKLNFLIKSPQLYQAFSSHLQGMTASGDSRLQIDIKLPLGMKNGARINGSLTMRDNSLSLEPVGLLLGKLNGTLQFTQQSLQAEKLSAMLLGQPSSLAISTDKTLQNRSIYIRSHGPFHAPDLANRYLPLLADSFSGDGEWDVSLEIPLNVKGERPAVPTLTAATNMRGVAVDLPPLLGKEADRTRPLSLEISFVPQARPLMRIDYDQTLSAIFELVANEKLQQSRGEFRLHAGRANLPVDDGYRLYAMLEHVSVDDWLAGWRKNTVSVKDGAGAGIFKFIELKAKSLHAFKQQYTDVQLQLTPQKQEWRADVNSRELQGSVYVPQNLSALPVRADLSYWHLAGLDEADGEKSELDPRDFPALDFSIDDFRYKQRNFNHVRLKTRKDAAGIRIQEAILKPEATTITLQGAWLVSGRGQRSNISLQVSSENVEQTLKAMGYVGSIDNGEGSMEVNLKWADTLLAADAANIEGNLHLDLQNGSLLDVNPGAGGRLFGLLSLQMLPRRLLLDFSDVFKKGFGFEKIEGDFNITDGNAYTNNLYMQGASARVDIAGRVGLVAEDYDQVVTVTPQVSDALPVLGALAATPQVGAAILFMQKLLKFDINKATRIQYSVTGDWKEPVITTLKTQDK